MQKICPTCGNAPQVGHAALWRGIGESEQVDVADAEDARQMHQLDVGHEALARFDALDGVLVDLQTVQLEQVGQLALGDAHGDTQACDGLAAKVVATGFCFVDEHFLLLFDIQCLSMRRFYAIILAKMTFTECQEATEEPLVSVDYDKGGLF